MPRLILILTILYQLISTSPAHAGLPPLRTQVLPDLTMALERYRVERQRLDIQRRDKLRKVERAYYLRLNTLKMKVPDPIEPKAMFETTEEYRQRKALHRKELAIVKKTNKKKLTEMQREGALRLQVAKIEMEWLKAQLTRLSPMAETIGHLQDKGCLMTGDSATITVQPPNADAFLFPVTINHRGTLYRNSWPYPDRDRAETIWRGRHELKVFPRYSPEPSGDGGIALTLTAFIVADSKKTSLIEFPIDTPTPFDAITRLERIRSDELPSARILMALSNALEGPLPNMRFVFVSSRPFDMGSPRRTPGRLPDESQHKVVLNRPFYIQTTEVTQAQWEEVMGNNPSAFPHCGGDCPIENIYWQETLRFITKLNALYKGKGRFRLPTESEWEYVARTGTVDPWVQSDSKASFYAWYRENSGGAPHPVATRRSNLWNIYDMNGNVSEWCSDWYGPYPETPLSESPQGPLNGEFRVSRGGSWFHGIDTIRGAHRNSDNAGDKSGYTGFRLVLDIPLSALQGADPPFKDSGKK